MAALIPPIGPASGGHPVDATAAARRRAPTAAVGEAAVNDTLPASPPPEVLAEVDIAFQRARELAREDRELRFSMEGARVRIELRDGDGNVLRVIPPSGAFHVAGGGSPDDVGRPD